MTYYISGESVYNDPNYYVSVFIHDLGYPDADYGTASAKIEALGVADDPFWSLGVETVDPPGPFVKGVKQAEFGLLYNYRFKADETSCWAWDGLAWVDLLAGGVPHQRRHEMTDPLDHEADTTWVMWYSDGAGPPAQVQEVALGALGNMLVGQGVAAAPIFTKTLAGCVSEATAFIVTDGVIEIKIWNDGTDTHILTDSGDLILDPNSGETKSPGKIWDACWN
jgi:hypothetical protein